MSHPGVLLSILMVVGIVGCRQQNDSTLVPVEGMILFEGQPVKNGTVGYLLEDGSNSYSGLIINGKYSLGNRETGIGAPPGKYRVAVTSWKAPQTMESQSQHVVGITAIPARYFDAATSGLEVVVPPQGGRFDFDLKP